jgi:hypothetical protein
MVLDVGSFEEFCGQPFAASVSLHLLGRSLLRTPYKSLPNTTHIFIRSPRQPSRMSFFHTASLHKLLEPSHNALVIRWSHAILTPKFTLNSNNGFKFCLPQHGLCFLMHGRHCTDGAEHVIKAAVPQLQLGCARNLCQ